MKKKGFTLIELLAVIVVLAIIALIATPIVMSVIKSAKKGAAERSADSYIGAVETVVATERLDGNILEGEYIIQSDGNLCPTSGCGNSDKDKIVIDVKGTKPSSGKITISNGSVDKKSSEMTIGDYDVSYDEENKKYEAVKLETYKITYKLTNVSGSNITSITTKDVKTLKFIANSGYQLPESVAVSGATYTWNKETGTIALSKVTGNVTVTIVGEEVKAKTYTNGEVVYFNVTTGSKCSSSDYTEAQSNTGVKEGCMKFYAFNDDGKDTVNLILDHNTTATVAWNKTDTNDSGTKINAKGPKEVLDQLKTDTESWKGTKTPANYTMDQSARYSKAKYTIDYSSYKARLITANEIATITGNTSWDEKTASYEYYFDTNTNTESTTCKKGNTTGCKYGWLYDRTQRYCKTYGCLNNATSTKVDMSGYWTASSHGGNIYNAWLVDYIGGKINYRSVNTDDTGSVSVGTFGVRPVIEVLKSKLA